MNKGVLLTIYVVLAVAIIAGGAWYADTISQPAVQSPVATQQQQVAAETSSTSNNTMDTLKITDVTVGTGTEAKDGDTVTVNYTGTFDNGTKFDSSLNPGRTPFSFTLGAQQVIAGWDQGVLGMKVGGTRELVVPPSLGYGPNDYQSIPGNSTLHFTITLLSVSSTASGQ
jgi:FKBP-type peptidyl-prolyl cis-trans isomerase